MARKRSGYSTMRDGGAEIELDFQSWLGWSGVRVEELGVI